MIANLQPFVSIILPVRNEAACIEEVLRAVLAQDYPHDSLEVIVAEGQSDDGTREIVRTLAAEDARLHLVENPRRTTTAALNLAIRAARGEVIVCVGGHGVVPSNYVRECIAWLLKLESSQPAFSLQPSALDQPLPGHPSLPRGEDSSNRSSRFEPLNLVGTRSTASPTLPTEMWDAGGTRPYQREVHGEDRGEVSRLDVPRTPSFPLLVVGGAWDCVGRGIMGQAIALATSSPFGVGNAHYRTCRSAAEPLLTDSVPFWVVRKKVFAQIGLFREEMLCHEDYEFSHRLRQAGGKVLLLPWLRSKYYVRESWARLARQYWRYGSWKGRFLRAHPESLKFRHLFPPLFVALFFLTLLAALATLGGEGWGEGAWLVSRVGWFGLAVVLGVYLGFLLLASAFLTFTRSREREFADSRASHSEAHPLRLVSLLPLILATLHFCWGAGVWFGLTRGPVPGQPPRL